MVLKAEMFHEWRHLVTQLDVTQKRFDAVWKKNVLQKFVALTKKKPFGIHQRNIKMFWLTKLC